MNVNNSDSTSFSRCKVRSKYFTEGPVMDESLSDFQEKKDFTIPKKTEKANSKNKPKKTIKRIKGQKDIRTALKSNKNELVAYSNDFDKICKQSGIEVDSEQLQLAIALSKSLQQSEDALESSNSQCSGSLTSQERTRKIRTTLLEYGFKVPEIKITASKSRKLKRHRKNYKLLVVSEAEKKQLLFDRYSQVLLQNIKNTAVEIVSNNETRVPLYHIATDSSYKTVKSNDCFYVKNLVEVNHVIAGGLLKDWSEIPGRPATPTSEILDINFSSVDYSHEDLDDILAGTLESAQEIIKEKYRMNEKEVKLQSPKYQSVNDSKTNQFDITHKTMSCDLANKTDEALKISENIAKNPVIMNSKSQQMCVPTSEVRSCSPDIFDDDENSIIDISKDNTDALSQKKPCADITKHKSSFMDLTECGDVLSQKMLNANKTILKANSRMLSQQLQEENKTMRRSNDFMEITDCVATSSRPVTNKEIQEVDLTQNLVTCSSVNIVRTNNFENKEIESMDLTQSTDSNDSLPLVQISGKGKSLDDFTILTENVCLGIIYSKSGLTKTSKSLNVNNNRLEREVLLNSKDLFDCNEGDNSLVKIYNKSVNCEVNKDNEKQNKNDQEDQKVSKPSPILKSQSFFEEFVHTHSDSSKDHSEDNVLCLNETHDSFVNKQKINKDNIDLTQSLDPSIEKDDRDMVTTKESLENGPHNNYEDKFTNNDIDLTQSSGSSVCKMESKENIFKSKEPLEDYICVIERHDKRDVKNSSIYGNIASNDIDLTQSSDSSIEKSESDNNKYNSAAPKFSDINSLGKIGDISIDYDEIFDDMISSHSNKSNSYKSEMNASTEKLMRRSHSISNSSNNSDVFVISDNELNYSLNKSRHEVANINFEIGSISTMDNLPKTSGSKLSSDGNMYITNACESINESFLPEVNLGGTKYDKTKNDVKSNATPFRNTLSNDIIYTKTPENSDYIIKTNQVTPMIDYESLNTPERNRELDKYGLKPFKRKRAVQLLTHLYNQTHPIVESCSIEDLPSPSKKRKKDNLTQVHISPKKISQSPAKSQSPGKKSEARNTAVNNVLEEINKENDCVYRVTNDVPEIKNIECSEEDWVFQKREKAKVHSCRVPLHVAFHNYVSCRQGLREAILRYEPVNIDVIHRGLVDSGHKYDAKELLKFMDKKCITVKTADNNAKTNRKHY